MHVEAKCVDACVAGVLSHTPRPPHMLAVNLALVLITVQAEAAQ
jgi:hypothetical protein